MVAVARFLSLFVNVYVCVCVCVTGQRKRNTIRQTMPRASTHQQNERNITSSGEL